MNFKQFTIFCFSGTGNTLHLARILSCEFRKRNIESKIQLLPCPISESITEPFVIMFPVYAQSAPPLVFRWLQSLPEAKNNTFVFAISTYASMTGFVKAPLKKILQQKGYKAEGIIEVRMPHNYITQKNSPENIKIIKRAEGEIAKFAENICSGSFRWSSFMPCASFFQKYSSAIFAKIASYLGENFYAEEEKCTKCGLCEKLCPTKNIIIQNGLPLFAGQCEQCLRCVNFCPVDAINIRLKYLRFIYRPKYICPGIKADDFLN